MSGAAFSAYVAATKAWVVGLGKSPGRAEVEGPVIRSSVILWLLPAIATAVVITSIAGIRGPDFRPAPLTMAARS
jgi:hypothetical protein